MDTPVTPTTNGAAHDAVPEPATSTVDELVQIGVFASDALKLAAHEARLAAAGAATALALVVAALVGSLFVATLITVASVFALHAAGLPWALAFVLTAVGLGLLCWLAIRRAGTLAKRLTLPVTRDALQPRPPA